MRAHAYQLPSEVYRELEAQILEALADASLEQLNYLLGDHDLKIELLSGEWRVLFAATEDMAYQVVDLGERRTRMAVSPDELSEFVDALPVGLDLVGLVIVEEDDDWMWSESTHEIIAMRPEVYAVLEPHMRALVEVGDFPALARLCGDHCEGAIEFSNDKWFALGQEIVSRAPELIPVIEEMISPPELYQSVRESLGLVADPRTQPSLDAWLRVHSDGHEYALYFRDVRREE